MKIFNLYKFNRDELEDFTDFSNEYWDQPWLIYVDCKGGNNDVTFQILDIVNLKWNMTKDVLMNVSTAYSNGFRFIMEFKGVINVLSGARGMWHMCRQDVSLLVDGSHLDKNNSNYSEIFLEENQILVDEDIEFSKLYLDKKQMKQYRSGKDVYFTEKDLKHFIDKK